MRHKGRVHVRPAGGGTAPRLSRSRTVHRTFVTSLNTTADRGGGCAAERGMCSLWREGAEEEEKEEEKREERGAPDPAEVQDNFSMRDGYDVVIGCLGFKFDFSIFDR